MKKFTDIKKSSLTENEISLTDKIKSLLEKVDLQIDGIEEPWKYNIKINPTDDFYDAINDIINEEFFKNKLFLLENAKASVKTKDISWIDEEINKIKKIK